MPYGTIPEWRKRQARKHASYSHHCPVCSGEFTGNGGYSSHVKACIRRIYPDIDPALSPSEMRREYFKRIGKI